MSNQPRNEQGQFGLKGVEERKVRTVRLPDSLWNNLGKIADNRCATRTDLIEDLLTQEPKSVDEVIILLEEVLVLKANLGNAIKWKIRKALNLLIP